MTIIAALVLLFGGLMFAAWADLTIGAAMAGAPRPPIATPLRRAALALVQQASRTEHPDKLNWILAPAAYLMLAAAGLSVVPLAAGSEVIDLSSGIVLWGACESLTVVIVFLHGWSANSPLPLIGGYRYVAIGLPVMLISMFVLILYPIAGRSQPEEVVKNRISKTHSPSDNEMGQIFVGRSFLALSARW